MKKLESLFSAGITVANQFSRLGNCIAVAIIYLAAVPAAYWQFGWLSALLSFVASYLLIAFGFLLVETAQQLNSGLERISRGDLSVRQSGDGADRSGVSVKGLDQTKGNLIELIDSVRHGTDRIMGAAKEINVSNNDLADRTEQQASTLEEVASTMEELVATIRENAHHCVDASQLASQSTDMEIGRAHV